MQSLVIPVELNAVLYDMEVNLAAASTLAAQVATGHGDLNAAAAAQAEGTKYGAAAATRMAAMEAMMWDAGSARWHDLHMVGVDVGVPPPTPLVLGITLTRLGTISASNFVPLWAGAHPPLNVSRVAAIVSALTASGLVQPAGVATTTAATGQQWDFPNGWAPLQHWLILGLNATGVPAATALADSLARRWLTTNMAAYAATGYMSEKYNVTCVGCTGGGGEYTPQVGFGWTNGAALDLLVRYNFASLD